MLALIMRRRHWKSCVHFSRTRANKWQYRAGENIAAYNMCVEHDADVLSFQYLNLSNSLRMITGFATTRKPQHEAADIWPGTMGLCFGARVQRENAMPRGPA